MLTRICECSEIYVGRCGGADGSQVGGLRTEAAEGKPGMMMALYGMGLDCREMVERKRDMK